MIEETQTSRQSAQAAWLAAIVESSDEAIISKSLDGILTSWNPAAQRLYGYTADEAIGRPMSLLIPADRLDEEQQILAGIGRGERVVRLETVRLRKDGLPVMVQVTLSPIRDAAGHIVGASHVAQDVTERKRAEAALRKSESELAEAQRVAQIGNWSFDIAADTARWSQELYRIFEVEETGRGVAYQSFLSLVHPDDRARLWQVNTGARSQGKDFEVEYRILTRSGHLKHIREVGYARTGATGDVVGLFGTAQDITERKRAEDGLRRHAARMEVLAEVSRTADEAGLDYQGVLNAVVRRTAEMIGDGCIMTLFSDDGQWASMAAAHHRHPQFIAALEGMGWRTWQGRTDIWRFQTVLAGQPIFQPVVDLEQFKAASEPKFQALIDYLGVSSFIGVPFRIGGRVIGALEILRDRGGAAYTRDDQVLLQDLADRAALTIQNAELFQTVREHRAQLSALSARLVEAQEAERRSIARELHDEIGQLLTGFTLLLDFDPNLPAESIRAKTDEARRLAIQLIDQVHTLSLDLRPAMLDDLGLLPALLWHFERYTDLSGVRVRFEQQGLDRRRFTPNIETTVYRVVQEALTNVARHAHVTEVKVFVQADADALSVQIEDAGAGFDLPAALAARATSGLTGMRERAALLGGQLTIETAAGEGSQVTLELPLLAPIERREAARSE